MHSLPTIPNSPPTPGHPGRTHSKQAVGAYIGAAYFFTSSASFANPAIPVLGVGLALTTIEVSRGRLQWREVVHAIGPVVLVSLFLVCVALGALARSWDGPAPAQLLDGAGRWETTGIGALASVTINNLPAAVLLSAHPVSHPSALLLGLNDRERVPLRSIFLRFSRAEAQPAPVSWCHS